MDDLALHLALTLGPDPERFTVEQLRRAWHVYGPEMLQDNGSRVLGVRPWAHWLFDLCEPEPDDHRERTVRLAELGQLTDWEVKQVRERTALGAGTARAAGYQRARA